MMTLMIAMAAAAAQPAAQPPAGAMEHHGMHMQMGQATDHKGMDHKGMDCCKDCCKDMAAKHEGHAAEHAEHSE
jgi:hypothetical protein